MIPIEIEMIHNRRRSHRPIAVYCHTPQDPNAYVHHHFICGDWRWNLGVFVVVPRRTNSRHVQWGYEIRFADGTAGGCQIQNIDAALAALGARVSLRGDND
jgi:hypothetical protein